MPECRFEVWPYLERFAEDATKAVTAELHRAGHGENPDFIIGNYSDGNLVASLMSHALGVTQCNIAHALEKTKYNDADINWCVMSYLLHVARFATQHMVVWYHHHTYIALPRLLHSTMRYFTMLHVRSCKCSMVLTNRCTGMCK